MQLVPRPWVMLGAAVLAQTATTVVSSAPAFLIPMLHAERGMSLAEAGLVAGASTLGLVFTLVLWGAATDRWGERRILVIGLAATAASVGLSMLADGVVWLCLALILSGGLSACANAASGRLIVGWFPPARRGLAMGIRQTCQPLGTAIASLAVPALAAGSFPVLGPIPAALALGGVLCLVACLVCIATIVDPARPPRPKADQAAAADGAPAAALDAGANPYRGHSVLQRIHLVSILLVVPQFALSTFGLVWFVVGLGWDTLTAGLVVAASQLVGAFGRIVVGVWSDRLGSRLRLLRWVAVAGIATMLLTAAFGWFDAPVAAAVAYVVASTISVADNGLAFTAVAEFAGPHWSGRALGVQNTGQFLFASIGAPAIGALITLVGYPATWALIALAPAIATPLVPHPRHERVR